MSTVIKCNNLVKRYGKKTIIPDLSVEINQGEFFTLLGPSGCGKTTLLRMIAGFNSIEGGDIYFGNKRINDVAPKDRNIGMVFQNYAIFPHLTAGENVAFGLKTRKVEKKLIEGRVDKILETVKISNLKNSLPENMSGGQQQRIALARAIVIEPDVLLMDEPLSNLDAKLRVEMRNVIKRIQRDVGITTVYVTHDQEEAMAVSDRIAVMNNGVIQHIGTPQHIYHRPANVFVASFIGRTNIISREVEIKNGKNYIIFSDDYKVECENIELETPKKVKLSIRPEEFIISREGNGLKGKVIDNMFLGINTHYFVELENGERVEIIQESSLSNIIPIGEEVVLTVKMDKINIFDFETEKSITKGLQNDAK